MMVFEFLGGWALALGKQKVGEALLKGIDQRLNPGELERYLAEAIDAANKEVPKLFSPYQADGLKGFDKLLGQFFKGRALAQLQKPLREEGKPDESLLAQALLKDAEKHSQLKDLNPQLSEDWMRVLVNTYFAETNNAIQFQLIRVDYCEQILRVFDDVKFAGIAVEGQDIDRAERMADIFVMPDLLEERHRVSTFPDESASGFRADVSEVGELINGKTTQERLIWEQKQEALRLKGRKLSASEFFSGENVKHVVLLGAPGSGKTMLMNYFAVVSASEGKAIEAEDEKTVLLSELLADCLPIIIRIRDLAQHPDMSVLDFVRYFSEKDLAVAGGLSGFFEHYLKLGKVLILLDGLDEVANVTQRYKVVNKIEAFLNQYGKCRTIITFRPAGYKRDFFRTDEFPHYELQPFDDAKIDTFIEHWYDSRFELGSERERRKNSLKKAFSRQSRIKQLARNPLLLTIIALIHRYQAHLPKERFKLYDKAVETLLTTWDSNKELSNHEILEYLELDDLRRLMEQLAYWIHCQGGTGDAEGGTIIYREELISQLTQYIREMKRVERHEARAEARRFLELIVRDRAGLLSLQGQDRYAFVHKTFQEYLTAMEIRDQQEDGFEVVIEHVEEYLHDAHWEEVLLLLIAQQRRKNPSKILRFVLERDSDYEQWLHRDLLFAGTILTENVPLSEDDLASSILCQLIDIEKSDSPLVTQKLREQIFGIVENLYETDFEQVAISILKQNQSDFEQSRFLRYLEAFAPKGTETDLLTIFRDSNWDGGFHAPVSLEQLDNANENRTQALIASLQDDNWMARYSAAAALGKLNNASENVVHTLIDSLPDDNSSVRSRVAEALVQLGNANENVIQTLIDFLQDDDSNVRSRAAGHLGQLGNANENAVHALIESLQDDNSSVRSRASTALGQLGNANENVVHALIESLQDDNSSVRSRAAEALGQLGSTSENVIQVLIDSLQDNDSYVRYRAAEALGQLGSTSENVVHALIESLQDDSSSVRYRATAALKLIGNQSAMLKPLLIRWIDQHQTESFVGNGIDVLQTIVN